MLLLEAETIEAVEYPRKPFRAAVREEPRRQKPGSDDLRDQPLTTSTLVAHFPELDRCTVMQHLKVLEGADLLIPVRKGRDRWNHLNPLAYPRNTRALDWPARGACDGQLAKLKKDLEKAPPSG